MTKVLDRTSIEEALRQISAILATASLYSSDHPRVQVLFPRLLDTLSQLLSQQKEITFFVIKQDLLVDGRPLEKNLHTERIAKALQAQKVEFVSFGQGVTLEELKLFFEAAQGRTEFQRLDSQAPHIHYGLIDVKNRVEQHRPILRFEDLTSEELSNLEEYYEAVGDKGRCDIEKISPIVSGFMAAFQQQANPLLALVPLRLEDEYSFSHSVNVAILNIAQAISLGLEDALVQELGLAGMLHDAGKIFVSKEIIQKSGKLDDDEWHQMQQHPVRGALHLLNQTGIPSLAILSAFEHHLHHDLNGYPSVPKDWTMNLCSEITMISDTFDALRTRRSYKEPWDLPRICGLFLELSGTQLHPQLTFNFLRLLKQMGEEVLIEGIELAADAPPATAEELAKRSPCE